MDETTEEEMAVSIVNSMEYYIRTKPEGWTENYTAYVTRTLKNLRKKWNDPDYVVETRITAVPLFDMERVMAMVKQNEDFDDVFTKYEQEVIERFFTEVMAEIQDRIRIEGFEVRLI